jgi:dienelactone hydrolase
MKCLILSCVLVLTLSSCAGTIDSPVAEVGKTWKFAVTMLPAKYSAMEMTQLAPGFYEYPSLDGWSRYVQENSLRENVGKIPVVLHMHGCGGISSGDSRWADVYADMGYLTILPNSFRRSDRVSMCRSGGWGYRSQLRIEEIDYALHQISKIPWIDVNRIFLSGHSEGGNALSFYRGEEFAAYIILGTNCRHAGGVPRVAGNIPVLNIVGSMDEFGYGSGCRVNRSVGGSGLVVVNGAGHDVSQEEQARRAVREFLENCCNN